MPIVGLTDRGSPTFPKIGDVRKGAPKTPEGYVGPDLTYFRAVWLEGEEEAAECFARVYGDEPREINVFLPFDEIGRVFEAFMELHTAGALQCRGDRVTASLWRDKDGRMQHTPKQCPKPPCEGCKETGRLKVIIPELRRLAYVEVHTTSIWDITEITANLEALKLVTGGKLRGIPLVLKRRPRMISTPRKNGKRVRQEKWMLSIEADGRFVDAQLTALEVAALPSGFERAAIPATVIDVDVETGEIVEEEGASAYGDAEPVPPLGTEELAEPVAPVINGQNKRPLLPEKVREFLTAKITKAPPAWQTGRATSGQRGLLVGKLTECFAPADDADNKQRAVLIWLIDKESSKELVMAEASALLDWLLDKEADDGTYDLHPAVASEAKAIYREAVKETGQQELEL